MKPSLLAVSFLPPLIPLLDVAGTKLWLSLCLWYNSGNHPLSQVLWHGVNPAGALFVVCVSSHYNTSIFRGVVPDCSFLNGMFYHISLLTRQHQCFLRVLYSQSPQVAEGRIARTPSWKALFHWPLLIEFRVAQQRSLFSFISLCWCKKNKIEKSWTHLKFCRNVDPANSALANQIRSRTFLVDNFFNENRILLLTSRLSRWRMK